MGWGIATCPRDGAPLICTMAWRGFEFYCLDCGGKLGFLSPEAQEETPENLKRMNAYQKEWDDNVGGKLIVQGRVGDAEQKMEHDKAIAWLQQRIKS